jgi:hypothetical protein
MSFFQFGQTPGACALLDRLSWMKSWPIFTKCLRGIDSETKMAVDQFRLKLTAVSSFRF